MVGSQIARDVRSKEDEEVQVRGTIKDNKRHLAREEEVVVCREGCLRRKRQVFIYIVRK